MQTSIAYRPGKLLAPQVDYVLLDGSGSMATKWQPTMQALDAFVLTLSGHPIHTQIICSVFSQQDLSTIQRDCEIKDWTSTQRVPMKSPFGQTPLYDAINQMGRNLKELDPPRCSIIIVTDGDENCSRYTTDVEAKAILDWCRAKGWQVTFMGCDFNNSRQAKLLGASDANSVGVAQAMLVDAAKSLAEKRAKYGLYGTEMHFTDEEKQQFGGYLAGPPA